MTFRHCVAVDLGASSGRVMLARFDAEQRSLSLREIHRFVNNLHKQEGFDTWDIDALEAEIRIGLNKVCDEGILIDSIGIDTWGVDFGLIDQNGALLGNPRCYRNGTEAGMAAVHAVVPQQTLFAHTGIASMPFNTVY